MNRRVVLTEDERNKNMKIELSGDLYAGHDGELYIDTDDGQYLDLYNVLVNAQLLTGYVGEKTRVRLIVEDIDS